MRHVVASIEGEYRRYKALAEGAFEQLDEEQLARHGGPEGNSVATVVWHVSGNLQSRFTDFLTSDGEKPWRDREAEFQQRRVTQAELREEWEQGFSVLFGALAGLDDARLHSSVTIRGVELSVADALQRSLAHTSYHVGQIVFLARMFRGASWRYLTIPPGGSQAYNANPSREKPPSAR